MISDKQILLLLKPAYPRLIFLLFLSASTLYAAAPLKILMKVDHWQPVQDAKNSNKTEVTFMSTKAFRKVPS